MIEDTWYPDCVWANKWNCVHSDTYTNHNDSHDDNEHLKMVSKPGIVLTVDSNGQSTSMASAIMIA